MEMDIRTRRRCGGCVHPGVPTLVMLLSLQLLGSLGSLMSVSAAHDRRAELPLLPPIDNVAGAAALPSPSTSGVEMLMIRLIRTFFGDQVKWSPFLGNQAPSQHRHHRAVREHAPNPSLQDELAKRRFRLRGKPTSSIRSPSS